MTSKNPTGRRPTGLAAAVVTPMLADGALDLPALSRHVEWLIEGGVDALMPCGTTGESATLETDEQRAVIATCVDAARGRVPVFAGAGTHGTAGSIRLVRAAREEGVDGLLLVTPYYNRPSQEGLLRHYGALAEAGGGLPIVLYNVPSRTGVNLRPETVFRLAELEPVVGVKEASGDLDQIMTIARDRPEGFLLLAGDDGLALPVLALGGDGVVSVAANEVPARMKALVQAGLSGDLAGARSHHFELLDLMRANFLESNPAPLKAALAMMGRMEEHLRLPLAPLGEENRSRLRQALDRLGLLEGG